MYAPTEQLLNASQTSPSHENTFLHSFLLPSTPLLPHTPHSPLLLFPSIFISDLHYYNNTNSSISTGRVAIPKENEHLLTLFFFRSNRIFLSLISFCCFIFSSFIPLSPILLHNSIAFSFFFTSRSLRYAGKRMHVEINSVKHKVVSLLS